MKPPVFLFVGGQSAGHLAPLVAVSHAVRELQPDAEVSFVCSDKPEDRAFLEAEGITPVATLPVPSGFTSLPSLIRGRRQAKQVIDAVKPDVVFSKGSAVSVPVAMAAKSRGVPVVLHESDTVSGRSNTIVSKFAHTVCYGFPPDKMDERHVFTGNPIRPDVMSGSRDEGLRLTGFTGTKPILLVMGGSQGAVAVNDAVLSVRDELLKMCDIIHLTGKGKETTAAPHPAGYWMRPFATKELPHLYAIATAAVSRGGAGSIGELAAWKIPSIIIPIEGLAQNHQLKNAEEVSSSGAFVLLRQTTLAHTLVPTVSTLLTDQHKRDIMKKAMETGFTANASRRLAEILIKVFSERACNNA